MKFEKPGSALTTFEETLTQIHSYLLVIELLRNCDGWLPEIDPNLIECALDDHLDLLKEKLLIFDDLRAYFSSQEYVKERQRIIAALSDHNEDLSDPVELDA